MKNEELRMEKKIGEYQSNLCHLCALLLLFTFTCILVTAQPLPDKDPGEISLFLGAGLSSLHHKDMPRDGFFNGNAIEFGIGYTHYFNRNWGIFIGAGPGIYNTQKHVNIDVFTPDLTDANRYQFDLYTKTYYREDFQTMFVNIPVMLQYQTKQEINEWWQRFNRYKGFYMMAGIKAAIPMRENRYEWEITSITNSAYYPEMDNWAATQKFAGLGVFNDADDAVGSDGRLELSTPCLKLALEAGFKWRIGNSALLYTGIFCDFGINNTVESIRPPINNHIVVEHITDFNLVTFSEKMNMTTAGIILRLSFFRHPKRLNCSYSPYKDTRMRNSR